MIGRTYSEVVRFIHADKEDWHVQKARLKEDSEDEHDEDEGPFKHIKLYVDDEDVVRKVDINDCVCLFD